MAALKPAYLIHGDDHGAVAERRGNLKALAEREGGAGAVEVLAGAAATPEGVALALSSMTLAVGAEQAGAVGRVIIVDGVERFRQAEVERHLVPAMASMPPHTTLALFAREDGRVKAPAALHRAVKAAQGQVVSQQTVKPWELPRWVREQAARLGLELDAAAAKALIAQVGERQQRLLREMERLALASISELEAAGGDRAVRLDAERIEALAVHSSSRRAFTLADALAAGDLHGALRVHLGLQAQGERISSLTYQIAARLREALAVARRLQAGESPAAIARSLRMPPKASERFLASVSATDEPRLKAALGALADLELSLRGGGGPGEAADALRRRAALSEQTLSVLAIGAIAGAGELAGQRRL